MRTARKFYPPTVTGQKCHRAALRRQAGIAEALTKGGANDGKAFLANTPTGRNGQEEVQSLLKNIGVDGGTSPPLMDDDYLTEYENWTTVLHTYFRAGQRRDRNAGGRTQQGRPYFQVADIINLDWIYKLGVTDDETLEIFRRRNNVCVLSQRRLTTASNIPAEHRIFAYPKLNIREQMAARGHRPFLLEGERLHPRKEHDDR